MAESAFSEATSLKQISSGRFAGFIPAGWRVIVGVHGGLIAALFARAASTAAGPERNLRSLTVHFVRPAAEGEVELAVEVEREGRRMINLSIRMIQAGETVATCLAAADAARESISHDRLRLPDVPPAETLNSLEYIAGAMPQFMEHADFRPVAGGGPGNPEADGRASVDLWMRMIGDAPLDHAACAFLTDAGWPTIFALKGRMHGAPTIDLTIHFRSQLPPANKDPWVYGSFESLLVHEGHFEESGTLWASDGTVLVQSRQLALVLPLPKQSSIQPISD